jgi:hypothetical protein
MNGPSTLSDGERYRLRVVARSISFRGQRICEMSDDDRMIVLAAMYERMISKENNVNDMLRDYFKK